MKCRWGNLLMNMAVNFKFGCACAGNLQRLMSVISVASEFGSVLRWVVKKLMTVFFTFVEFFWWILCFLLQPKFTLDGTPAINFLVQAQWCWFLISSRSTMSIYYCTYHGSRQELSHCCIYAMYVFWMMWRLYILTGMQKFQANSTTEFFHSNLLCLRM